MTIKEFIERCERLNIPLDTEMYDISYDLYHIPLNSLTHLVYDNALILSAEKDGDK